MNKVQLKVVGCTESTENAGNFLNKLQNKTEVSVNTAFGTNSSNRQTTYYLWTDQANAVGTIGELDLSQFNVIEKDWTSPEGDDMKLKYLYPKV